MTQASNTLTEGELRYISCLYLLSGKETPHRHVRPTTLSYPTGRMTPGLSHTLSMLICPSPLPTSPLQGRVLLPQTLTTIIQKEAVQGNYSVRAVGAAFQVHYYITHCHPPCRHLYITESGSLACVCTGLDQTTCSIHVHHSAYARDA
jgi:hypothetical protein